ncbi:DUF4249 family protein [Aurantibacter crassamenti]|uniref:DUF4249 family protein n=1 Tax=Aurantibacter crassamenti TaxID=1837375 RepID=UPI00193A8EDE|nr:DUF4249 family protein [Aurantibacter crassamenti]MBM1107534.1 DUF4249 family protein [Aurantibacter crassamenti]
MKNWPLAFMLFFIQISCQDVITVDPPTEAPRLSVDALIRIDKSEPFTTAVINTALTSSFFEQIEPTDVDLITISNLDYSTNENILVLNKNQLGHYSGTRETAFFTSGRLVLNIEYENVQYQAETTYAPAVPIDKLEEGSQTLFTGDETEILVTVTDAPNRTDFYLFDFSFDEYLVSEDTFYPGQKFQFSYFYEGGLKSGYELEISILGIDEQFYNYMNQLIVQAGGDQGPFQSPAATVRGNIIKISDNNSTEYENQTNAYILGYFAVSEEYKKSIILE